MSSVLSGSAVAWCLELLWSSLDVLSDPPQTIHVRHRKSGSVETCTCLSWTSDHVPLPCPWPASGACRVLFGLFPTPLYHPWWLHFHQCLRPSETSLAEIFRLPRQCQMEHEGSDDVRMECWTCTAWSFLRQVSTASNLKLQFWKHLCSRHVLYDFFNRLHGECSLLIALLKSLGSMQILSFLGVSTMTMLFSQSVGSSCFLITPSFSILWSSSLTRSWSATGGEYSSSFLAYPQHQITVSLFFVLRPQWTFEHELYMLSKGFPFSHQISTIPIKFRITWRSIHFTVHLCTYLASYGFCSSGCFWIETHPTSDTMLYLYVGEHIKPKQPCGETCFIHQRSPLFLQYH